MGFFRNIFDKSGTHKSFVIYAIVLSVICVVFLFLKRDNVIRWVQAEFSIRSQEKRKMELREKNAELDRRIEALSSDRDSLEKFARETYQFAEPGDDVYLEEQ